MLDALPEGAEPKFGTLSGGEETWGLASYGKGLRITRHALIKDDLGAFGTLLNRMGSAFVRLEKTLFWAQFTSNPKLADGKEVSHGDHKNVTASAGAAPDADQVAKGRLMLRTTLPVISKPRLSRGFRSLRQPPVPPHQSRRLGQQ